MFRKVHIWVILRKILLLVFSEGLLNFFMKIFLYPGEEMCANQEIGEGDEPWIH